MSLVWRQGIEGGTWQPLADVQTLRLLSAALFENDDDDEDVVDIAGVEVDASVSTEKETGLGAMNEAEWEQMARQVAEEEHKEEQETRKRVAEAHADAQAEAKAEAKAEAEAEAGIQAQAAQNKERDDAEARPPRKRQRQQQQQQREKQPRVRSRSKWVRVTGLPPDVTEDEITEHFRPVGMIAVDPLNGFPDLLVQRREEDGKCTGECLLAFMGKESVEQACLVLDEGYIRASHQIRVQRANAPEGMRNRQQRLTSEQARTAQLMRQQALSWNDGDDDGIAGTALKVVVLQNMYRPEDFGEDNGEGEEDDAFERELDERIAKECSTVGDASDFKSVTIFPENPLGVVMIRFHTGYAASECVRRMNGRTFAGRKIHAQFWDGATDYSGKGAAGSSNSSSGSSSSSAPATDAAAATVTTAPTAKTASTATPILEDDADAVRLDAFGNWLEADGELPEEFQLQVER